MHVENRLGRQKPPYMTCMVRHQTMELLSITTCHAQDTVHPCHCTSANWTVVTTKPADRLQTECSGINYGSSSKVPSAWNIQIVIWHVMKIMAAFNLVTFIHMQETLSAHGGYGLFSPEISVHQYASLPSLGWLSIGLPTFSLHCSIKQWSFNLWEQMGF